MQTQLRWHSIVRLGEGMYVGSPTSTTTSLVQFAATFRTNGEAEAVAAMHRRFGAEAVRVAEMAWCPTEKRYLVRDVADAGDGNAAAPSTESNEGDA